ncbi:hypothetical protein FOZ60_016926 [Perkinsus olseni]|uniref:Mei2-like C-terminal RNA recognition motif domain-containing protein n=1 Tax=Perkinsus olseni TaxID=32597 RepID=A0A7J6P4G3_PEROL|nr:hypothetical protein FOZ60_016926 [Perkinsus olseni]
MVFCDAPSEEQQHAPIEESLCDSLLYSDVADDETLHHLLHAAKSLSSSSSPLLQSPPLQYLTATDVSLTTTPILVGDYAGLELLSPQSKAPPLHTPNDESRAVPESLPESNGSVSTEMSGRIAVSRHGLLIALPYSASTVTLSSLAYQSHDDARCNIDKRTTLMLRNIPYKYNRDDLVVELQNRLPVGSFDFVYLPMDFRSTGNFGYAFVNMTAPTFVEDFYTAFNGTYLACPGLQQLVALPVRLPLPEYRGFDANISRLLKSPIWAAPNAFDTVGSTLMELALPAIFTNGVQQPFPRPDPNRLHRSLLVDEKPFSHWPVRPIDRAPRALGPIAIPCGSRRATTKTIHLLHRSGAQPQPSFEQVKSCCCCCCCCRHVLTGGYIVSLPDNRQVATKRGVLFWVKSAEFGDRLLIVMLGRQPLFLHQIIVPGLRSPLSANPCPLPIIISIFIIVVKLQAAVTLVQLLLPTSTCAAASSPSFPSSLPVTTTAPDL